MKTVRTATLEIAYEEAGPADGRAVILLHGFPDDVHAYDGVAPSLAAAGWRVLVPYLRGYGPTRFLDAATPRSGQQAVLGRDLADFMDALGIVRAKPALRPRRCPGYCSRPSSLTQRRAPATTP